MLNLYHPLTLKCHSHLHQSKINCIPATSYDDDDDDDEGEEKELEAEDEEL